MMAEIGQIVVSNPVGYNMPEFACALMDYIRREISLRYWNINQSYFGDDSFFNHAFDWDEPRDYTCGVPGMEWRPYYKWGGAPEDDDWDRQEANKPNFSYDAVEVRWYKNFGSSMNCNVHWSPSQWVTWFDKCIDALDLWEERKYEWQPGESKRDTAAAECPECGRWFKYPARRCGYDGTKIRSYA